VNNLGHEASHHHFRHLPAQRQSYKIRQGKATTKGELNNDSCILTIP
jgi:hypothetical protein